MRTEWSRRALLKVTGLTAAGAAITSGASPRAFAALADADTAPSAPIYLNLNENAFGPSEAVAPALTREFGRLSRYASDALAQPFLEQVATYEHLPVEQVIPGEILGGLGLWLGSRGGHGGEFLYSAPGYTALVDAAAHVGGEAVPIPLNARYENDLDAFREKLTPKTRAIYLINPHNPTGTVTETDTFLRFLREISQKAPVIVDEAYLEYTPDFERRSAVQLVREGANVLVFRTFDKIHGLAGLPIGYTLAPASVVSALRQQGYGNAESLGRLNITAASAALGDTAHGARVRNIVSEERAKWTSFLDRQGRKRSDTVTNFVFFDAGLPQVELAAYLRKQGIEIGRTFPPYTNWARITIGLPEENRKAQGALERLWR
ncbi:pyridoxal phosphate-dependent aminotransferase [Silvibacterium dinghuense]|uniref:pyridoxal phosphate-dependent aminotransferase n=1 Tax=Silvibacterium dinghuense TaxID=1560006 RepID=UPI00195E3E25|nr:histidinol-phosphate transaminase [Silvibacterium dinghuense]